VVGVAVGGRVVHLSSGLFGAIGEEDTRKSRRRDCAAGETVVYARGEAGKKLDRVATLLTVVVRCAARRHDAHRLDGDGIVAGGVVLGVGGRWRWRESV